MDYISMPCLHLHLPWPPMDSYGLYLYALSSTQPTMAPMAAHGPWPPMAYMASHGLPWPPTDYICMPSLQLHLPWPPMASHGLI